MAIRSSEAFRVQRVDVAQESGHDKNWECFSVGHGSKIKISKDTGITSKPRRGKAMYRLLLPFTKLKPASRKESISLNTDEASASAPQYLHFEPRRFGLQDDIAIVRSYKVNANIACEVFCMLAFEVADRLATGLLGGLYVLNNDSRSMMLFSALIR
ncbi:hypothetical protein FIBSPDRAFT_939475 [Athelia psychrophila]|uniref:Uncharacterized protein n=1 Tax=Athelia psychrophila TaxID=1759441 RepID=A0A167XSP1_9AGAM|nr:hypothetical protein FIBSPDRAFT_939475 [Fibularhizoctonia sp. CBS 109695]